MKTGFKKSDEIIDIQNGNLIVFGRTASVGKTNVEITWIPKYLKFCNL